MIWRKKSLFFGGRASCPPGEDTEITCLEIKVKAQFSEKHHIHNHYSRTAPNIALSFHTWMMKNFSLVSKGNLPPYLSAPTPCLSHSAFRILTARHGPELGNRQKYNVTQLQKLASFPTLRCWRFSQNPNKLHNAKFCCFSFTKCAAGMYDGAN